jgi:hypothetical protein
MANLQDSCQRLQMLVLTATTPEQLDRLLEVLEQAGGKLSIEAWAELLHAVLPTVFAELPAPLYPTHTLAGSKERIAVYTYRAETGFRLFHDQDSQLSID